MGEKGKEGKEETCISMGNFDFLVPFPLLLWGKGYLWNFLSKVEEIRFYIYFPLLPHFTSDLHLPSR